MIDKYTLCMFYIVSVDEIVKNEFDLWTNSLNCCTCVFIDIEINVYK